MNITLSQLQHYPGATDVEKAMVYVRTLPGRDRLSHDETWAAACDLVRACRARGDHLQLTTPAVTTEEDDELEALIAKLRDKHSEGLSALAAWTAVSQELTAGKRSDDDEPAAVAARRAPRSAGAVASFELETAALALPLDATGRCIGQFEGVTNVERAINAVRAQPGGTELSYDTAHERGCELWRRAKESARRQHLGMEHSL